MRHSRVLPRILPLVAVVALGMTSLAPALAQEGQEGQENTGTVGPESSEEYTVGPETYSEDAPTTSDLMWANPNARSADPDNGVSARVTAQSAAMMHNTDTLELTIEVSNSSEQPLSGLELRAQHADPVDSSEAVATSLLANQGEYPWIGEFIPVDTTIAPGESREIKVTVPVGEDSTAEGQSAGDSGRSEDARDTGDTRGTGEVASTNGSADSAIDAVTLPGLGIISLGVHPLLFNLNGTLGDSDTSFLAGARTTLTITDKSTDSADSTGATGTGTSGTASAVPGLTVLWPLSSAAVAVAGQVGDAPDPTTLYLPDETLATELSAGGRLRGLLDTWRDAVSARTTHSSGTASGDSAAAATTATAATRIHDATCLAIDPDLLETVERMTDGYRVGPVVPSPVEGPTRLRDSWGHHDQDADSVDGTGADAATTWLNDLRDVVADSCVVPLPFANTDINAIAASSDSWLAEELRDRGVEAIKDILGVTPATGVYIPGSGYIEADALPTITGGSTDANGAKGSNGTDASDATDATDAASTGPVTAIVADSTLTGTNTADRTPASSTSDSRESSGTGTRSAVATLTDSSASPASSASSVRALYFPAELGSALAATGNRPETAAYTSPSRRRDLATDGAASRMAAAVAVLDRELDAARTSSGQVLAVPPAVWSVDATDAATFLDAVSSHFSDGSATPVTFGDALAAPAGTTSLLDEQATLDPAPVDDGEALNVSQIAGHLRNFTKILDDVPNIALTRRIYTQPMFDDLLRSLSNTGRRVRTEAAEVRQESALRTGRVTGLAYELRNAVTLLPPGNVFTRTSDSSPLIVVARNGLPLPVTVRVNYSAADGVTLNTPGVQQIPARGSVTLQMTSSIPKEIEQSDLTMYLSTPGDVRISDDVTMRVASVPGLGRSALAVILGAVVLVVATTWTLRRRRHASGGSPSGRAVLDDGSRD